MNKIKKFLNNGLRINNGKRYIIDREFVSYNPRNSINNVPVSTIPNRIKVFQNSIFPNLSREVRRGIVWKIYEDFDRNLYRQLLRNNILYDTFDHYNWAIEICKKYKISTVLDIGCSIGFQGYLFNLGGINYYGLDSKKEMRVYPFKPFANKTLGFINCKFPDCYKYSFIKRISEKSKNTCAICFYSIPYTTKNVMPIGEALDILFQNHNQVIMNVQHTYAREITQAIMRNNMFTADRLEQQVLVPYISTQTEKVHRRGYYTESDYLYYIIRKESENE